MRFHAKHVSHHSKNPNAFRALKLLKMETRLAFLKRRETRLA